MGVRAIESANMCGIAGLIDLKARREPDRGLVQRMAASLVHRGPDDSGFLFAPGIGLANRRLSIVGIEDGRQPLFNENRSIAVLCNGELFDFPERRAELEAKGHIFRTHSDSELIVHLYEEHGDELFPYLKGQFAFVLIDFASNVAILARDRVGICPLFWSRQGDYIYFGSEIKALLASGAVKPEVDPLGLDHLFTFFALGSRRTTFNGIQAVAPGHYVKINLPHPGRPAMAVERKYWDFEFPDWGDEDDSMDERRLVDAFEEVFARAVAIRLRADVPVAGYLSGGVDSAYVIATAARVTGSPVPTFTLRIPDLDEVDGALETSRGIGARCPTVVEAGPNRVTNAYAALTRAAESPVLDTSCAALLALSQEVHSQGYKVALTGEGADEAFAGYIWFKIRELARMFDVGDAFRPSTLMSRLARKWAAPNLTFGTFANVDAMIGGPHAQSIMYNLVATSRDRYFSAELKEELGSRLAYQDLDLDLARMARWHPLNRSLYVGYKIQMAGLLLTQKGDRVAMANSVETRYPFLDEDVIALASRLHPRWKLRGGLRDKYLLRQAAGRILPEAVAQRPKHMFRAPLAETFLARPPAFVSELISAESLARTGYFDIGRVRRDCRLLGGSDMRSGLGTFARLGLGGVVATQLWHHLYLGGGLCSLPLVSDPIEPKTVPLPPLAVA
jgi:asparagine synthase (glutamine-hydrolysing)